VTTTTEYEFQVLSPGQVDAIRSLQSFIGAMNAEKGFHDEGDNLRSMDNVFDDEGFTAPYLRNYYTARLALVTTEVAEAVEELRNGRAVDETYYLYEDGGEAVAHGNRPASVDPMDRPRKPEGVPSEVADVVVRSFDFADEAQFDLAEILDRKLAYNASRPKMHGRKF
jgi:hypothetical protein